MISLQALRRRARWSNWLVVVGLWCVAAVLSSVQIYLREAASGGRIPWSEVLAANLLAWIPWLGISPVALWLERRFPVPGSRTGLHLLIHVSAAVLLSAVFLFYLAYFHASYLEAGGLFPSWETLQSEYAEKLGQHFLVSVMLYAAIVLGSFSYRLWSAPRVGPERLEGASLDPDSSAPLIARSVGEMERIDPCDVDWIESCGNYARLHVGDRGVLIRRTLASLAEDLGPVGFARVHRSVVVNVGRVVKLRAGSHGDATVELESGRRVKVSRTYRKALEERFE